MPATGHPLTQQLGGSPFEYDLRRSSPGSAPLHGGLQGSPRSSPAPCVVFLTRAADGETTALQARCIAQGIASVRLDADRLGGDQLGADQLAPDRPGGVSVALDLQRCLLVVDGTEVRPTVVWKRHFAADAVPQAPNAPLTQFVRQSWDGFARQLGTVAHSVIGATDLGLLEQLSDAAHLGVSVPRTVVAPDARTAGRLLGTGHLVAKALHSHFVEATPGTLTGVFPRVLSASAGNSSGHSFENSSGHSSENSSGNPPGTDSGEFDVSGPPAVFQEFVEHTAEIRAYLVGDEVAAFRVEKEGAADLWHDEEAVRVVPCPVPDGLDAVVRKLASQWALHYGAFDFLMSPDGPVFLEVNTDGDWRWFEGKAQSSAVSSAAWRLVAGLHEAALKDGWAPSGPPGGALNLASFLAL